MWLEQLKDAAAAMTKKRQTMGGANGGGGEGKKFRLGGIRFEMHAEEAA